MPISAALLPEFEHEMAGTRRALERAPEARLDWGPHPKSMTLRGLVTHLANIPVWGHLVLAEDHFDLEPPGGESTRMTAAASVTEALARFDANVAKARAALQACSDEHWLSSWSLRSGGATLFTLPRVAVVRGMVMNHLIHHRGQLTVYLRLLDVPVPALYGPSADERPTG
jgi:uncharacterized damage-inducible protein DinB